MTAVLIGLTCVAMNCLLSYSGRYYMDSIGSYVSAFSDTEEGEPGFFDPEQKRPIRADYYHTRRAGFIYRH